MSNQLSEAIADAVESAAKSIVRVDGRRRFASSGIAWSPEVAITAAHTLRSEELTLGLADGTTVEAHVAGWDPATDVAVLKTSGLTPIEWSDAPALRVGNFAIAAARPGRSIRATFGIISALGREWRTPAGGRIDRYIEVDAALPPGFSGGPLLDVSGKAIGMNTSRLIRTSGATIPAATLRRVVTSILEHGSVRRGFLGVSVQAIDGGLIVIGLAADGPAQKAGVLVGDVITAIDDTAIDDPASLHDALREEKIGSEATLHITRGGETKEVKVTVGAA
jgi:serine protease DegQ